MFQLIRALQILSKNNLLSCNIQTKKKKIHTDLTHCVLAISDKTQKRRQTIPTAESRKVLYTVATIRAARVPSAEPGLLDYSEGRGRSHSPGVWRGELE